MPESAAGRDPRHLLLIFLFFPAVDECFGCHWFHVPVVGPTVERVWQFVYHAIPGRHYFLPPPAQSKKNIKYRAVACHQGPALVGGFFKETGRCCVPLRITLGNFLSQSQQHSGNVNIDRTGIFAGTAEGFPQKQILGPVNTDQKGGYDGTHRPGVSKAIGMTADFAVNRAYVQAGGAADAAEHFPEFFICQYFCATVVDNDEVKFIRSINLVGQSGPAAGPQPFPSP